MLQIFLKRQKQAQQPRPGIKFNKAERFPAEALEEDDSVRRSPPRAHEGDEKHTTLDRATATANLSMLAETTTGIAREAHLDGHVLAQPQLQVPETMAVPMTEALPDQTPHLALSETKLLPETGTPKKRYEKVDFLQQLASVERDVRRLNQSDSADRLALQRQLEEAQEVSLRINNQLQEAMRISQQEGFVGFVRVTPLEGGADAEFVVPFREGETVAALKGRIEENEGIPLGMQLLILDKPDGSSSRLTGACSAAAASHVLVQTYGPTLMLTLPSALIFWCAPCFLAPPLFVSISHLLQSPDGGQLIGDLEETVRQIARGGDGPKYPALPGGGGGAPRKVPGADGQQGSPAKGQQAAAAAELKMQLLVMDGLASESETKQELDTTTASLVAPASPAPTPATPAT